MIAYENNIVNTATITDISIQPVIGAIPSGATNVLDNGQVIVDLYDDEDIPLSLSVDDFKNVAEQVQSYSKAFNLPATKRNNKIFDQIFEITRSYDGVIFNPYRRIFPAWFAYLSFMFFPVVYGVAPFYSGFALGDWTLFLVSYLGVLPGVFPVLDR